jgi:hypothetical protein
MFVPPFHFMGSDLDSTRAIAERTFEVACKCLGAAMQSSTRKLGFANDNQMSLLQLFRSSAAAEKMRHEGLPMPRPSRSGRAAPGAARRLRQLRAELQIESLIREASTTVSGKGSTLPCT